MASASVNLRDGRAMKRICVWGTSLKKIADEAQVIAFIRIVQQRFPDTHITLFSQYGDLLTTRLAGAALRVTTIPTADLARVIRALARCDLFVLEGGPFYEELAQALRCWLLLGIAKFLDGEIEARVHPTMIPSGSPVAGVEGVYNAIQLVGDAVNDIVLYGQGAGSMPTGSAVVSDVISIARNLLMGAAGRVPPASFQREQRRPLRIRPMEDITSLYYLRFMVLDRPGVLSQIAGVLGQQGISISSVLQKGRKEGQTVPVVIMTHTARERQVQSALREINRMAFISEPTTLIRVEGPDEGAGE